LFFRLLNGYSGVCRLVYAAKVLVLILVIAGNGNHGCIVGGEAEFRDVNLPSETFGVIVEGITKPGIGRYTSGYGYFFNL
jgi:hypothetical protein